MDIIRSRFLFFCRNHEYRGKNFIVLNFIWNGNRGIMALLFIILSGLAIGASWLCYYRALQDGLASVVVPIDKLSILITILFSRIVFGERLNRESLIGLVIIVVGTILLSVIS